MSRDEIARLDVAISALPDSHLPARTALLLTRHGILPADVCRLRRRDFTPPDKTLPGQVTGQCRGAQEITILSDEASTAVSSLLSTHESPLILPGLTSDRLTRLLHERMRAAQVRQVSPETLRNSVRLTAMAGATL